MSKNSEWFSSWFDTPFYHILYKHRDSTEAEQFIDALFKKLQPKKTDLLLDLACGRGRHAVYMNKKGYRVVGIDLAEASIDFARNFENENLHFEVHDMRQNFGENKFDWIFNLFTSFGYFEHEKDDEKAANAIAQSLKPGGKLVLDFMNANKVAKRLVPKEHKTTENIDFYIERYIDGENIVKEIKFAAEGRDWRFEEKVKCFEFEDFERLFKYAGLEIIQTFGSLDLQPFNRTESDRLILIAQKK